MASHEYFDIFRITWDEGLDTPLITRLYLGFYFGVSYSDSWQLQADASALMEVVIHQAEELKARLPPRGHPWALPICTALAALRECDIWGPGLSEVDADSLAHQPRFAKVHLVHFGCSIPTHAHRKPAVCSFLFSNVEKLLE